MCNLYYSDKMRLFQCSTIEGGMKREEVFVSKYPNTQKVQHRKVLDFSGSIEPNV